MVKIKLHINKETETEWENTCLACMRLWVWSPALQKLKEIAMKTRQ
jgi:hypothetical protein